eukprot:CAMPEP_0197188456 /NCGR_PEP_ID=MMETSP1423-20130617/17827_1 /TAXON_ID=476441 /ORGANISM="Pseudo-nitzschia heimii, Strain UNC1101" /LENGTH=213 /DNA_ID=CAMNT_0042640291 /DNA_START=12 /DNA_END=653 /DNA_ORIENTATION=-
MKRKSSMNLEKGTRQGKNSVMFAPTVLIYRTMHINDFTDEEINDCWYSDRENKAIVSDCVKIISSMNGSGKRLSSSISCFRGLECRTPQGQKRRASHRFCAFDAVLDEQDTQWDSPENDITKIRDGYRVYSKPSHVEALRIGLEDEKEAMIIYDEGDSCTLRSSSLNTSEGTLFDNQLPATMGLNERKFLMSPKTTMKNIRTLQRYHYSCRAA